MMLLINKYLPAVYIKKELDTMEISEVIKMCNLAKKAREIEINTLQTAIVQAFSED